MDALIVAVGSEIVAGRLLDTNSQWLSDRLSTQGIWVRRHVAVGDRAADLRQVLATAPERLVITTGGIGPTKDDLTRETIAAVTGRELVRNEAFVEHIRALFTSRGRTMPDNNLKQADTPAGSHFLFNRRGTAAGFILDDGHHVYVALPGVPHELRAMFDRDVMESLRAAGHVYGSIRTGSVHCFGLSESKLDEMLADVLCEDDEQSVGLLASGAVLTVRVTVRGGDLADADARVRRIKDAVRERVGRYVFGEDGQTLWGAVAERLCAAGATLAVAECGTGGLVSHYLTEPDTAAEYFRRGFVLAEPAGELAAVTADLVAEHGAVSEPVALALAEAAAATTGAYHGLATTCGSDAGTGPGDRCWLAHWSRAGATAREVRFRADRAFTKELFAKAALQHLRLRLDEG